MSTLVLPQPRRRRAVSLSAVRALAQRPELLLLLAVAGVLNLWALDLNGYANDYYAAAVRSMTPSWHAFLYGSFDAAGLQTVDKPPLALWVQALSARVFGFNSWALLVPQALMGVATVGLVYDLARSSASAAPRGVRRGPRARADADHGRDLAPQQPGRAAGAVHHRRPCGRPTAACEDGRARWLLAAGAFVGLGFETKMAAALLVVPGDRRRVALGRAERPRRRGPAAAGGRRRDGGRRARVAGADVADARVVRPYISGTDDNSIWSLILGYNGLGRLFGQDGGPGGGDGRRGGGGVFGGDDRAGCACSTQALGGQAGWLLGFALVAGVALVVSTRLRRNDAAHGLADRRRRRVR